MKEIIIYCNDGKENRGEKVGKCRKLVSIFGSHMLTRAILGLKVSFTED